MIGVSPWLSIITKKKFNSRYILDEEGIELVNHYALENANAVIVNGRNIFVL